MRINSSKIIKIYSLTYNELNCAIEKHPIPMRSAHEGYAILKEEVDELWDAIKLNESSPVRDKKIKEEAYHVAAMSLRFLMDVIYKDD